MRRAQQRGNRQQAFAQAGGGGGTPEWVELYNNLWGVEAAGGDVDLNAEGPTFTDRFGVPNTLAAVGAGLDSWTITPAGIDFDVTAGVAVVAGGSIGATVAQILSAVGGPAYRPMNNYLLVNVWKSATLTGIFCNVSQSVIIKDGATALAFMRSRRDKSFDSGAEGVLATQINFDGTTEYSGIEASVLTDFAFGTEFAGAAFQLGYSAAQPSLPPESQASLRSTTRLWVPKKTLDTGTADIGNWTDHEYQSLVEAYNLQSATATLERTILYGWGVPT